MARHATFTYEITPNGSPVHLRVLIKGMGTFYTCDSLIDEAQKGTGMTATLQQSDIIGIERLVNQRPALSVLDRVIDCQQQLTESNNNVIETVEKSFEHYRDHFIGLNLSLYVPPLLVTVVTNNPIALLGGVSLLTAYEKIFVDYKRQKERVHLSENELTSLLLSGYQLLYTSPSLNQGEEVVFQLQQWELRCKEALKNLEKSISKFIESVTKILRRFHDFDKVEGVLAKLLRRNSESIPTHPENGGDSNSSRRNPSQDLYPFVDYPRRHSILIACMRIDIPQVRYVYAQMSNKTAATIVPEVSGSLKATFGRPPAQRMPSPAS